MNIIAIIPARYQSTRFPGKPLADLFGKPMIYWVYNRIKSIKRFSDVIIATDDKRIMDCCNSFNMHCEYTSCNCKSSTERAYEIANKFKADFYVVINGDEPLIDPKIVEKIIPTKINGGIYVANLCTEIKSSPEVIDFTNIKVVLDADSNALFMSRSPIPYPKSSLNYKYYKHVGVLGYNYEGLNFFAKTEKGDNEKIEDINELRFIEHGVKIKMIKCNSKTLSVDTYKDLETVRDLIKKRGISCDKY